MYKLLLCLRYLRTRYIALASIISVMLGVATMIVVNSVMAGFSFEMQDRIHGILADLVFESHSLEGFPGPQWHMQRIRETAGDDIESMTAIVHVPALLSFQVRGQWINRQVSLIGIDPQSHADVSDFAKYLQHPANRERLSFLLREDGYDQRDPYGGPDAPLRQGMQGAGWQHRRKKAAWEKAYRRQLAEQPAAPADSSPPRPGDDPFGRRPPPGKQPTPPRKTQQEVEADDAAAGADLFAAGREAQPETEENIFDPAQEQHTGAVLGIALASIRDKEGNPHFMLRPGDDVRVMFPSAGAPPKEISDTFTVVDFYESKMSEYDSSFVFVPLETLQRLRGMIDPTSGVRNVTSIQIKLKEGRDPSAVRDKLRAAFPPEQFPINVSTWRDKQGPLLAAVEMETVILNILLFLIIAVAGFGILATFFMIVVEKTRDIGILKSLGASGRGIMGIFLAYGLSLGGMGAVVGMFLGLLFVHYINQIAGLLGAISGRELFDPSVYFFQQIPTIVDPLTIGWIVAGAMLIAVTASVLPALRAAMLHPVEALRYE